MLQHLLNIKVSILAGGATAKVLTTMKTMPTNMVTVSKAPGAGGKQTIVITKPGPGMAGVSGTAGMSVGMPGRPAGGPQIIVVTTASGLRTVQAVSTAQTAIGKFNVFVCDYSISVYVN